MINNKVERFGWGTDYVQVFSGASTESLWLRGEVSQTEKDPDALAHFINSAHSYISALLPMALHY